MEINRGAPVVVVREVEVAAPPARVWEVHTDVARWAGWHPGVSFSALRGGLEPGVALHWRLDGIWLASRIEVVDPERKVGWTMRSFGVQGVQIWTLETRAGGTVVRTEESLGGWAPFLLRRTVRRTVERSREAWLAALKRRVEGGGPPEPGPGTDPPPGPGTDSAPHRFR